MPAAPPTRAEIAAIVVSALREILASADPPFRGEVTDETPLLGRGAVLESLGLVTLVVDVEQRLQSDHGVEVILADERAMSQKSSPFRSVGSLVSYTVELLKET